MTSIATAAPSSSQGAVGEVRPSVPGPATLGDLYDRYGSIAYSLALSITNDAPTAERVVTSAFATTWRALAHDSASVDASAFFSGLMTTVRSRAVAGRQVRTKSVSFALPNGQHPGSSLRTAVATALCDLPGAQQQVLELAYFGGLGVGDIASEINQPVSHVKVNLQAALGHLRAILAARPNAAATR